jgi:outer membrane immunogenic protein
MLTKALAPALLLTMISGMAEAADLPIRQPAGGFYSPLPISNWSGFYVGVNAGAAFEGDNSNTATVVSFGGAAPFGIVNNGSTVRFIGGGQVGANWQISQIVLGLEADGQGLTHERNIIPGAFGNEGGVSFLGTARGRVGAAFGNFLLYGTGGVAFGNTASPRTIFGLNGAGGLTTFNASRTDNVRVGFAAGGGIEYGFWNNWSVKAEYLYTDLGHSARSYIDPLTGSSLTFARREREHIVRAGLNYRFSWFGIPGAVAARY